MDSDKMPVYVPLKNSVSTRLSVTKCFDCGMMHIDGKSVKAKVVTCTCSLSERDRKRDGTRRVVTLCSTLIRGAKMLRRTNKSRKVRRLPSLSLAVR
jgi:hypothetical protein